MTRNDRRRFLARVLTGAGALALAGCDRLSRTEWFPRLLGIGEALNDKAHHLITSRKSMAQEFTEADLSPNFRSNGTSNPNDAQYRALAAAGFAGYRLQVDGLVEHPAELSLDELRALPARTQITRHDCVEGWSAIGKWHGVPLSTVLDAARLSPRARYIVFHCADRFGDRPYYESIDLIDAFHPQTILAVGLNERLLPVPNGAPVRLRVERQLGYKHAKYIQRIQAVENLAEVYGGKGGYWEDTTDYEWYAGI
jgi:DMSO/TMAO reductase YedYZ molybdopterin-dependent catalytic subunit